MLRSIAQELMNGQPFIFLQLIRRPADVRPRVDANGQPVYVNTSDPSAPLV